MEVVLQAERHECGLACLVSIIRHHGGKTTLQALRQRHKLNVRGTNAYRLVQIAQQEGVNLDAFELEEGDLQALEAGTLLHYRNGHYTVYAGRRGQNHVILDPDQGRHEITQDKLENLLSGVVLCVRNISPGQLPHDTSFQVRRLASMLKVDYRQYRGPIAKVVLLTVAVQASLLMAPQYLQAMVDKALPSGDLSYLAATAAVFVLLTAISAWSAILRTRTIASGGLRMARHASVNLLDRIRQSSLEWHERQNSSSIHLRQQSIMPLQRIATQGAIDSLIDVVLVLGMLVMMAFYSLTLTGITIATTAIVALTRYLRHPKLMQLQEQEIEYEAKEQAIALENLTGIRSLHVYNGVNRRHARQLSLLTGRFNAALLFQKAHQELSQAATALYSIDTIVIVAIAISYIMQSTMTLGALMAFMMYKAIFSLKSEALIERLGEIRLAQMHIDRLADILTSDDLKNTSDHPVTYGSIVIDKLHFAYHGEEMILKDICLKVDAGEMVAITGPTGEGKSTLAKLIAGMLEPTKGSICIDGKSAAMHRPGIVFMMQDDMLYTGTIAENVDLSGTGSEETIRKALKDACMLREVDAMPLGLNTLVGGSGVEISGGQKQRILIARALHANPVLLIMDEATSSLDEHTQAQINDHLDGMGVTRIVIAHRKDTIERASKIFCIKNGYLLDSGLTALV